MAGFVAAQRDQHGVPHATACRALGVSPAWFYKWRHGDASPRHARRARLAIEIGRLFAAHCGRYGSPRIAADRLNRRWYADGTDIATGEGRLVLDSVLDMASRRIVGFALGEHHDTQLA